MANPPFILVKSQKVAVPSGTVAGKPLLVGGVPMMPIIDRDADGNAVCENWADGTAPELLVNAVGTDIEFGTKIYNDGSTAYDPDAGSPTSPLTNDATGNTLWGYWWQTAKVTAGQQGTGPVALARPS